MSVEHSIDKNELGEVFCMLLWASSFFKAIYFCSVFTKASVCVGLE